MSTQPSPCELPVAAAHPPLGHLFCTACGTDGQQIAMCGLIGGRPGEFVGKCVVCLDLEGQPCPRCGVAP